MLDLSIAIVTYNNERTIKKCIESIIQNIDVNLSYYFYVIDNCSTDNTLKIIKEIATNIFIIQNKKNVGFGTAHNQLLPLIQSQYHAVINPDIVMDTNCFAEMIDYMNKNDVGLLSPLIKHPNGCIQYLCKRNPTFFDLFIRLVFPNSFIKRHHFFEMRETGYNKVFQVEYATGCFMLFRTDIFKILNGFDEKFFLYLEDADITRRVNEISKTLFYPYCYVIHEWQRGSHKSIKLALTDIRSAAYYFHKWGFKFM